jgi:hypothetical protein
LAEACASRTKIGVANKGKSSVFNLRYLSKP